MSVANIDPPVAPVVLAEYLEGLRLQTAGDLPGALRCLQTALRKSGIEHPEIMGALAVLADAGGDLRAAEKILRRVLSIRPSRQASLQLAIVFYKQKRFSEAAEMFAAILPNISFNAELHEAFSFALENAGDYDRSLAVFEQVLAREPTIAHAVKFAATLLRHGDHQRLEREMPALLARFPGSAGLLEAEVANVLGQGDYGRGFALMRARRDALGVVDTDPRLAACARWNGQPFDGTLLVSLENHVGEEIMMASALSELVRIGQHALVEVDARFIPLFSRSWPTLGFVDRRAGALAAALVPGGEYRRAVSLDLMQVFARRCVFPGAPGWLRADPDRVQAKRAEYRARWPGKKIIGISWRSARPYNGVDVKSVSLDALAQTLAQPGSAFVSLQYGDVQAELDRSPVAPWRDPSVDAMQDFEALAAQIAALDQVITVSNVTAHFAGALGVPTTVLLPKRFPVLWHWGYAGEETTWYQSVRLLRNPRDADWSELDRILAEDLAGTCRYAGPDSRIPAAGKH